MANVRATRMSILTFMMRVSQPKVTWKRVALCIGLAFGVMWIETIAQRLETCTFRSCGITTATVTTQSVSKPISPTNLLSVMIIFLFSNNDSGLFRRHTLDCASDHILVLHKVESRTQIAPVRDVFCEHGRQCRHGPTSNSPFRTWHERVHHCCAHQGEYPLWHLGI